MKIEDMSAIKHFNSNEITSHCHDLEKISFALIKTLDNFRELHGKPVTILDLDKAVVHAADSYHYRGMAVDFTVGALAGSEVDSIVEKMLRAGFKGIGCYWNTVAYSFHGDIREWTTLWRGTKKHDQRAWVYDQLVKVPF